ncbi:MAG: Bacterial rane flanked domain protein [Marmoricola sp.]|nr:Bacterial rane flanked domain protein [Marmoricola sp.]
MAKLLNDGEHVIFSTRTHVKVLLLPALVLILVAAVAGYLSSLPDGDHKGTMLIVIWVVAGLAILWFTVWPFLNWLVATYTVTNRRLITREGVITREGHDIPLNRISDVRTERGLLDRMLGCGTLVIADASTKGEVSLHDIPKVEAMQLKLSDQLFHGSGGSAGQADDDGT